MVGKIRGGPLVNSYHTVTILDCWCYQPLYLRPGGPPLDLCHPMWVRASGEGGVSTLSSLDGRQPRSCLHLHSTRSMAVYPLDAIQCTSNQCSWPQKTNNNKCLTKSAPICFLNEGSPTLKCYMILSFLHVSLNLKTAVGDTKPEILHLNCCCASPHSLGLYDWGPSPKFGSSLVQHSLL